MIPYLNACSLDVPLSPTSGGKSAIYVNLYYPESLRVVDETDQFPSPVHDFVVVHFQVQPPTANSPWKKIGGKVKWTTTRRRLIEFTERFDGKCTNTPTPMHRHACRVASARIIQQKLHQC